MKNCLKKIFLTILFIYSMSNFLYAQVETITGKVTQGDGEPLIGITIQVKGGGQNTSSGTITDIDGNKVEFTGDLPTLLLKYKDKKGTISKISTILSSNDINIATMKVTRERDIATMVVETDTLANKDIIEEISKNKEIFYIKAINPIDKR